LIVSAHFFSYARGGVPGVEIHDSAIICAVRVGLVFDVNPIKGNIR
jgi:hypothetical protein